MSGMRVIVVWRSSESVQVCESKPVVSFVDGVVYTCRVPPSWHASTSVLLSDQGWSFRLRRRHSMSAMPVSSPHDALELAKTSPFTRTDSGKINPVP